MVSLRNVTKKYGADEAVRGINLNIEDGQFVVLVGTSGCGKTTTLKMINRLIEPTSGEISIDGKNIKTMNPVELRRNIGYVIQQIGLFPNMTILENVEIVPKLLKWPKEKYHKKALDLLEMVDLPPTTYADKYPSELSGGQQQRIGVLRALAGDPSLILMDEPFGALDPITRDSLQDEVKKLHQTLKKTFVFVTHDMAEAIKMADIIVFMDKGNIVQVAPPEEILENPANDFVRNFIGMHTSSANRDLSVVEVMRKKPVTVTENKHTLECVSLMNSKGIDSLIVTDEDGRLKGIVTAENIRRSGKPGQPIKGLIDNSVGTVSVTGSAKEAFDLLLGTKAEYLIVVDAESRVAGMITRTGMVRSMAEALWGDDEA
ncbi:ABC transporter ATP-binding protein [Ethanoligenens harbinense]|uniref:Quaternary amine transport ATP-binding protein n=1 Tax=Ethanoligenens harbinense (strain DSM 18485 / JCM 12961 / CGMCC 1.5033 / YUAN-3) TaxID=663278 RepID=E6U554_ETHHY|nr:ABC transporter ATP-binding protein [Ethanoligenens harbinense]ADU27867.1 glycine betaine/L-proline ABC transporter, ATPase subunit [Ethanoligenens harbinense YUAN-3]AVQ96893.1 CBS domain-containing protein [Ethanoligenens harbinense YUAN-3]AYF39554.1 CBS domain-containing protein [Ethanoligenens harbinense]AYF42380.1 CBS domain-containing protein [Ethanoligenens harbinense]QCN93133.1 ATP-binding cassette domain-containing protein [Ethanoligenens harbinense]